MQHRKTASQAPKTPTPKTPQARKPAPAPAAAPRVPPAASARRDALAASLGSGPKPAPARESATKPAAKPARESATTPASPAPKTAVKPTAKSGVPTSAAKPLKPRDVDKAPATPAPASKRPTKPAPPLHISRPDSAHEQAASAVARPTAAATPSQTRQPSEAGGPPVPPAVAAMIHEERGRGRVLPPETRRQFESRLGGSLAQVRIHDGPSAASAADQLHAEAFTSGQDIFFGRDKYDPHTETGKQLLAHELTHTLQHHPATAAPTVFRKEKAPASTPEKSPANTTTTTTSDKPGHTAGPLNEEQFAAATALSPADGQLDEDGTTITFADLLIPAFKLADHRRALHENASLRRSKNYERNGKNAPTQGTQWRAATKPAIKTIEEELKKLIPAQAKPEDGNTAPLAFKTHARDGALKKNLVGDLTTIAEELTVPMWNGHGDFAKMEIDHIVELQISGWPEQKWADRQDNYELLVQSPNGSSGSLIRHTVRRRVEAFIAKLPKTGKSPSSGAILTAFDLRFLAPAEGGEAKGASGTGYSWTLEQINTAKHITSMQTRPIKDRPLQFINFAEATNSKTAMQVSTSAAGGRSKALSLAPEVPDTEKGWLYPYEITAKTFTTDPPRLTSFHVAIAPDNSTFERHEGDVPVTELAPNVGYIDKSKLAALVRGLRLKQLSPIVVDELDVGDSGLLVTGKILPTLPILEGVDLGFALDGPKLELFLRSDLKLPGPLKLTSAELELSADMKAGIQATGTIEFEIDGIGHGSLSAGGGNKGLTLAGNFEFDSRTFSPAVVDLHYENKVWSGQGTIGIPAGKIPGVRKAELTVGYAEDNLSAKGSAELDLPGLKHVELHASHSPKSGLEIGGSADLADLPGIRSGTLDLTLHRKPTGGWSVSGAGRAKPKVAGFDTDLAVRYEDGVFNAEATAAFTRGALSGGLKVGVTNRAVPAAGDPPAAPGDAPATGPLKLYGGGNLTLKLAPWLQGTAAVDVSETGALAVRGKIGLPSALDLFPEKKLDRSLVKLGLDLPIIGVAAAGLNVGVFATIRAGLDALASFGPGQLRKLELGVEYNPEKEDSTHVTGDVEFHVPARAGLRAFVSGGIGAGAGVTVSGSVEFGGFAGFDAAADFPAHIDWTPTRGLSIDATAQISATPKFCFDVTAVVLVEAGAFGYDVTLYEKRWNLASFEYGSQLAIGATVPLHYGQGQPFALSMDDVQLRLPQVDVPSLLKGLVTAIV